MSPEIPITPSGSQDSASTSSGSGSARRAGANRPRPDTADKPSSESPQQDRNGGAASAENENSPSEEELRETTELLNKSAQIFNRDLRFNVLQDENLVQAEVVNKETDEVIQKIPPDELIEVRKKINEFLGLFIDELR